MIPADLLRDLQEGKLSQRCPTCGTVEAAGGYSTCHETPTGPADWYRPTASPAARASLARTNATRQEAARSSASGISGRRSPANRETVSVRHRAPRFGQTVEADARASRQAQRQRRTPATA